MTSLRVLSGFLALGLLAACGSTQQQTDTTQSASAENQPATASTEPAPPPQSATPQGSPSRQPARQQSTHQTAQQNASTAAPAREPAAPPKPVVHMVTVPAGTVLSLAVDTPLNSKVAQVGDGFMATIVEPIEVGGQEVIPAGAMVEGKVTEAVAAKRGAGNAKLALSFDVLKLKNGYQTNIVGSFREKTASKKKKDAAIIGGSAAGGALLGRILGKDTKGAVVGALVGGGIGTAVVMGKEGEQVKIPANTPFEIQLEEAIQVPVSPERS